MDGLRFYLLQKPCMAFILDRKEVETYRYKFISVLF